ncbi:MAG: type 4a pilus biogenesis protein PilO [Myxococcales bacterium]|nr:type 4a pilus biogenesis protein PilO [Myxococcales bacterium]
MAPPKKKSASSSGSFDSLPTAGKAFILVLILGLVGALYLFVFHIPLTDDIDAAKSQHQRLRNDMRQAEQRQQDYLQLTQELASREGIDRANKRVLPEEAEIPAFLQDLNRVAELSGLEIRRVEPRPEENEPLYVRIPVALRVAGKYHQIAKFFYSISRLDRAINMENIAITNPTVSSTEEVVLTVNALATTFRRPSEPTALESRPAPTNRRQGQGGMR